MAGVISEISPFSLLPEDCKANILSFTTPKDACRAAAVSFGFKSAADSDYVWERFLPPDYKQIVPESASPAAFSSKKDLYFFLCDSPLLLDGGKLSFSLCKSTGRKCYMLCARELQVAWIDNTLHWEWTSSPESRYAEVAELKSVCWLDIRGILKAQMLSPNTTYVGYIVFKISDEHYGLDQPSMASVKFVGEDGTEVGGQTNAVYIVRPTPRRILGRRFARPPGPPTVVGARFPQVRTDGWLEIELGEVFIGEGEKGDIHAQLCETQHLNWKKGIIVEGIELRPKEAF